MADVRENFEISKEDPKYMICTICGSRLSKDSKETTFQKHLETKKHLKELSSLDIERKEEFNDAEIVTENETLEKLEEERVPSFLLPRSFSRYANNTGSLTCSLITFSSAWEFAPCERRAPAFPRLAMLDEPD